MNHIKFKTMANPSNLGEFLDDLFNTSIGDIVGTDFVMSRPSVNIKESETDYLIEVAAPGLNKEDFNIVMEKDQLKISVEKEDAKEESEDGKYKRREFNYSNFKRRFTVPESVDVNRIKAKYENGVLKVMLSKKEEIIEKNGSRTIEIL